MKTLKLTKVLIIITLSNLITSCDSTTLIDSSPSGATITIDGIQVGTTPIQHRDIKVSFSTTTIKLEKEGYEPLNTSFKRDEKFDWPPFLGGFFTVITFAWIMKYEPEHNYQLQPKKAN